MAWATRELERRNLSHVVVSYALHDDEVTNSQAVGDAAEWLRLNAPSIIPQTNTGAQGPDTLYTTRQPWLIPEDYAINGETT